MLPYVVYSHTDYLDVLEIQTEYLKSYENKYLLINNSDIKSDIFSNYKDIIYYDDALTYPSRLLSLKKLNFEHILFIHDMDIVLYKDDLIIEDIYSKMIENNIDRVDLQFDREHVPSNKLNIKEYNFYLNKQTMGYAYNVNPSIWKLSSLLDVMIKYHTSTYRAIENDAQQYCKDNYLIYRPYNEERSFYCGYYECIYFFKFLHITHHGEYLPLSNFSQLDQQFIDEWLRIVDKFNLRNNNKRNFKLGL